MNLLEFSTIEHAEDMIKLRVNESILDLSFLNSEDKQYEEKLKEKLKEKITKEVLLRNSKIVSKNIDHGLFLLIKVLYTYQNKTNSFKITVKTNKEEFPEKTGSIYWYPLYHNQAITLMITDSISNAMITMKENKEHNIERYYKAIKNNDQESTAKYAMYKNYKSTPIISYKYDPLDFILNIDRELQILKSYKNTSDLKINPNDLPYKINSDFRQSRPFEIDVVWNKIIRDKNNNIIKDKDNKPVLEPTKEHIVTQYVKANPSMKKGVYEYVTFKCKDKIEADRIENTLKKFNIKYTRLSDGVTITVFDIYTSLYFSDSFQESFDKNLTVLIEKLEKITNKKVLLKEDDVTYSKYAKPIKIDERLLKIKEKVDKYITIDGNELTYGGNVDLAQLKVFEKFYSNYIINVKGEVFLNNYNLKEILIKFGYITSFFSCSYNNLTSLKGCPEKVEGSFHCDYNKLTSLEGCPREIGGGLYCRENLLTSLKGCPKEVDGVFYCHNNAKQFTKKEVRDLCKVKGEIYV